MEWMQDLRVNSTPQWVSVLMSTKKKTTKTWRIWEINYIRNLTAREAMHRTITTTLKTRRTIVAKATNLKLEAQVQAQKLEELILTQQTRSERRLPQRPLLRIAAFVASKDCLLTASNHRDPTSYRLQRTKATILHRIKANHNRLSRAILIKIKETSHSILLKVLRAT